MKRIPKKQTRTNKDNVPPFINSVMDCTSWEDLCMKILPDHVYFHGRRSLDLPMVFNNPVTCRLYDALYNGSRKNYARDLALEYWNHIERLPDDATVFEIGCGAGTIFLRLAQIAQEHGKKVNFIGCDISTEMIYLADRHLQNSKLKNVSFFTSALENRRKLSSSLKRTKLLISRNVLSWINDPDCEISLWKSFLSEGVIWISREVRRDISFDQFKRRLSGTCHFSLDGQILAYPVDAFLISYLRAFTANEHHSLLKRHFEVVKALPIKSSLISDLGSTDAAESQFICTKED